MATATSRSNAVFADQENQKMTGALKKRGGVEVTRAALGVVTNKVPASKNAEVKRELRKPITRQRTTVNLKKYGASKPTEKTDVSKASKLDEIVKNEPQELMEIGTPDQKVEILSKNIFDLDGDLEVEDIDKDDFEDPQLCSEFVNNIYQYMLYLEAEYPVQKHYLKDTTLRSRMRTVLVDWLCQVHHRFGLLQETLYLTIAILDMFLQVKPVPRTKLQLAGVTAMLLASKYEEMYAPEVNDFVYITDKAFSRAQILQMEILILKTLNFNLGRPLPLHFLRRNSKAGQVDARHHTLAKYLMELSLVDYEMCHVPPSRIAAAALCLSLELIDGRDWCSTLQHYSRYNKEDLFPVICHLAKNLKSARTNTYLTAIRTKYASQKAFKISQADELKVPLVDELCEKAAALEL